MKPGVYFTFQKKDKFIITSILDHSHFINDADIPLLHTTVVLLVLLYITMTFS